MAASTVNRCRSRAIRRAGNPFGTTARQRPEQRHDARPSPAASSSADRLQNEGRIRPYLAHPDLQPCLPPEDTGSFPSGHAVWFRTNAELLADLLPERRDRLQQVGRQGGANRVFCGVHDPSDVEAGQRLGAEAARQIIACPQRRAFRSDPRLQQELGRLRNVPQRMLPMLVR